MCLSMTRRSLSAQALPPFRPDISSAFFSSASSLHARAADAEAMKRATPTSLPRSAGAQRPPQSGRPGDPRDSLLTDSTNILHVLEKAAAARQALLERQERTAQPRVDYTTSALITAGRTASRASSHYNDDLGGPAETVQTAAYSRPSTAREPQWDASRRYPSQDLAPVPYTPVPTSAPPKARARCAMMDGQCACLRLHASILAYLAFPARAVTFPT